MNISVEPYNESVFLALENTSFPPKRYLPLVPYPFPPNLPPITTPLLALLSILAAFANLMVILSFITSPSLRIPPNVYIVSLASADLCISVVIMPASILMLTYRKWPLGTATCHLILFAEYYLMVCSILTLIAISLDRLVAVSHPVWYSAQHSISQSMCCALCSWILAFFFCIPFLVGDFEENVDPDTCSLVMFHRLWIIIYMAIFYFVLPILIIGVMYSIIFCRMQHRLRAKHTTAKVVFSPTKTMVSILTATTRSTTANEIETKSEGRYLQSQEMDTMITSIHSSAESSIQASPYKTFTRNRVSTFSGFSHKEGLPISNLLRNRESAVSGDLNSHKSVISDNRGNIGYSISDFSRSQISPSSTMGHSYVRQLINNESFSSSHSTKSSLFSRIMRTNSPISRSPGSLRSSESCSIGGSIQLQTFKNEKHKATTNSKTSHEKGHLTNYGDPTPTPPDDNEFENILTSAVESINMYERKLRSGELTPPFTSRDNPHLETKNNNAKNVLYEKRRLETHQNYMENNNKQRVKRAIAKERRLAFIMALIIGAFILCYLPFWTAFLTLPFCTICPPPTRKDLVALVVVQWLAYTNSLVNPILYTAFNADFRAAITKIILKLCCCKSIK